MIAPLAVSVAKRSTLRVGDSGAAVRELQTRLEELGRLEGFEAGSFDEATQDAVQLFQLQHIGKAGTPSSVDGVAGTETWWALLNPHEDAQRNHLSAPASREGLTAARAKLLDIILAEHGRGVREAPNGSNRSPEIDRYWGNTGILGKAWCCAFVSWGLQQGLGRLPIQGKHHIGVQRMWVAAQELRMATERPKPGDIFVQLLPRGQGHTGFVVGVSEDNETIYTCEGNCANRLKLAHRPASSIQHFIDCIQDGQADDFPRGTSLQFESVGGDANR